MAKRNGQNRRNIKSRNGTQHKVSEAKLVLIAAALEVITALIELVAKLIER